MKKEYSVLVKFRKSETKWHNATSIVLGLNRRHVNTYEEAKDVLETVSKAMEIIDYKIRVREVTKWVEI